MTLVSGSQPRDNVEGNINIKLMFDSMPTILGDDWVASLEDRKREEAEFHDDDRVDHIDEHSHSGEDASRLNRRFYQAMGPPSRQIERWVQENAPGSVFLDYACGHGALAISAAKAGASISVGIDISKVSVQNAAENADSDGVADSTRFLQRDCENTMFPDNTFDLCICSGVLHHMDLPRAYAEIHRIMKPGGQVLCFEALDHNPLIRLYRKLTPQYRTAWEAEHILKMRDMRMAEEWFEVADVRFFNLIAPVAMILPLGFISRLGLKVGHSLDQLLCRIPILQLWSWMFMFRLVKR